MKTFRSLVVILALITVGIAVFGYLTVQKPVNDMLNSDTRNAGILVEVHYEYYLNPKVLIFDLKGFTGEKTRPDILRTLLQSAESLRDKDFDWVKLEHNGVEKFMLKGQYFKELGQTYNTQNPMYTMRTFTEHVFSVDGVPAFSRAEGGVLYVLGEEMNQFKEFSDKWYVDN